MGNLREIGKFYNLEGNVGNLQEERGNMESKKSAACFEEEEV